MLNFITKLNSVLKTIQTQYPNSTLQLQFSQPSDCTDKVLHLQLYPADKLYLWALQDKANQITFIPTDPDEIDDAGVYTTQLTTTDGLTIIIAEDF